MKYVFSLAILLLALSIPGINIYHHLELPDISFDKISSTYSVDMTYPFLHKNIDVTFGSQIYGYPILYYNTIKALNSAEIGDTVTFHLSGYGGDVQTTVTLMDAVKSSKAYVTMVVEGPCYSGHAYLAASGNRLIMRRYSFLMFHCSTVIDMDCSKETGVDRGVTNKEHCEALKTQLIDQNMKMLFDIWLLTPSEKASIMTGHDVYLSPEDIESRIH